MKKEIINTQNDLINFIIKSSVDVLDMVYLLKSNIISEQFIIDNLEIMNPGFLDAIVINQKLSEQFLDEHYMPSFKTNDIRFMCTNQTLSESFIEKYSDIVNWKSISQYQKLSIEFLDKHSNKIHFKTISEYQKLTEEFIEKYCYKVDWRLITKNQNLSESFIEKHILKLDLKNNMPNNKFSEEFLAKHIHDKLNIDSVLVNQKLSKEFIIKHIDLLDPYFVTTCQEIDTEIIELYINNKEIMGNYNIFDFISEHQKLTEEFILKYKLEVNWLLILKFQKLSEELLTKFVEEILFEIPNKILKIDAYFNQLFRYQEVSEDFINKHCDNQSMAVVSE